MDIEDFQRRLKQKHFDTEFDMQRMKYGGADPMLELGMRLEPNMRVVPTGLKRGAGHPTKAAFRPKKDRQPMSGPELLASHSKLSLEDLYSQADRRGLLAPGVESIEDWKKYPKYKMTPSFIGVYADKLGNNHWNHEIRHLSAAKLYPQYGHLKSEAFIRLQDLEHGNEFNKNQAKLWFAMIAKESDMTTENLMDYLEGEFPPEFATTTDAIRMIDQLKKKFKERKLKERQQQ
jgi:hypothetical protein